MMMDRVAHLHCARVYLAEARRRRMLGQGRWAAFWLQCAGNARRAAMAFTLEPPAQGNLFAQPGGVRQHGKGRADRREAAARSRG